MNSEQRVKETKEMFIHAVKGDKKPKRVPILSNDRTLKIFDEWFNISECFYDYSIMAYAV